MYNLLLAGREKFQHFLFVCRYFKTWHFIDMGRDDFASGVWNVSNQFYQYKHLKESCLLKHPPVSITCLSTFSFITFSLVGAVGWSTVLQVERSRVRFPMMSLEFFIDIILVSGSTQSVTWILPGGKVAGAGGWYPCQLYVPIVSKSGNLKLLEPSGLEIWEPQTPGILRACWGLFRGCFTFLICSSNVLFKLSHLTCMNCH